MAQLPFIKQNQVSAGISKTRSNAVKVYCSEAIAANDILSVIGLDTSGTFLSVARADANGVATLNNSQLFVADYAAALGDYTPVALPWKVVDGVNTIASAIGDPVYLSNTPGSVLLPGGSLKVGTVLTAAASGTILLAPQGMVSNSGIAVGPSTTMIGVGAVDIAISLTQPAGTVLVDAGCVLTAATVGVGNTDVKFGTALDGSEICAAVALISGAVGAVGSAITVGGAQGEGAVALVFAANASLYTSAARTIYFRAENSATITAGTIRPFIKFERI